MAEIKDIDLGQLFAPGADLSVYEAMPERDLYLDLMRGVFDHQGLPADDRSIMAPFVGLYVAAPRDAAKKTSAKVQVAGDPSREINVETKVIPDAYAGMNWPWGPESTVALSTLNEDKVITLSATARQEHQELFLGAKATILDPLTGKPEEETSVMPWAWVGTTPEGEREGFDHVREHFTDSNFREVTAAEKRTVGVVLQGLGQLAAVAA